MHSHTKNIIEEYKAFIGNKTFPCIAARAALASDHIKCMLAGHLACPKDDSAILQFLYSFVDEYRLAKNTFHSAAIIFKGPQNVSEEYFDQYLWQRLGSIAALDAQQYQWDKRVSADVSSASFSFSIKEEAFFIIGLQPGSSRASRQFAYPALAFNPHQEFEKLRATHHYEKMKEVVRKRDLAYSGSLNPMLRDFGEASEVFQYSGRKYNSDWQCPLDGMSNGQ
jgi:FPC/CPF motif-containing protein YcgG